MRTQFVLMIFLIFVVIFIGLFTFNTPANTAYNQNVNGGQSCPNGVCIGGFSGNPIQTNNLFCPLINLPILQGPLCTATGGGTGTPSIFSGTSIGISIGIAAGFILLGIFAGTFGAGSLANVIASTGIMLSFIYFLDAVISNSYANVSPFILLPFDSIVGTITMVLLMDALKQGSGT